jgi:hypothetical protein
MCEKKYQSRLSGIMLRKRRPKGKWIGYNINALSALFALSFLWCRTGQNLFMGPAVLILFLLAGCGLILGLPLSIMDLFNKERRLDGIMGIFLSLTPIPLFMILFIIVWSVKNFTFY